MNFPDPTNTEIRRLYRSEQFGGDAVQLFADRDTITATVYGESKSLSDSDGTRYQRFHIIYEDKLYCVFANDGSGESDPNNGERVVLQFKDTDNDGDMDIVLVAYDTPSDDDAE